MGGRGVRGEGRHRDGACRPRAGRDRRAGRVRGDRRRGQHGRTAPGRLGTRDRPGGRSDPAAGRPRLRLGNRARPVAEGKDGGGGGLGGPGPPPRGRGGPWSGRAGLARRARRRDGPAGRPGPVARGRPRRRAHRRGRRRRGQEPADRRAPEPPGPRGPLGGMARGPVRLLRPGDPVPALPRPAAGMARPAPRGAPRTHHPGPGLGPGPPFRRGPRPGPCGGAPRHGARPDAGHRRRRGLAPLAGSAAAPDFRDRVRPGRPAGSPLARGGGPGGPPLGGPDIDPARGATAPGRSRPADPRGARHAPRAGTPELVAPPGGRRGARIRFGPDRPHAPHPQHRALVARRDRRRGHAAAGRPATAAGGVRGQPLLPGGARGFARRRGSPRPRRRWVAPRPGRPRRDPPDRREGRPGPHRPPPVPLPGRGRRGVGPRAELRSRAAGGARRRRPSGPGARRAGSRGPGAPRPSRAPATVALQARADPGGGVRQPAPAQPPRAAS